MPIHTEVEPEAARCNPLFLLLCQVIVCLVQFVTANPGSNETKEKMAPGNSRLDCQYRC